MKRFLLFVVAVAIFLGGVYVWTHRRRQPQTTPAFTPASGAMIDRQNVHILAAIDQENTLVVEKVLPSVVSITTSKKVQTGIIFDPYRGMYPKLEDLSVLGSGVIVSKEGHILTNFHVVAGTDKIQVELNDGRIVPAQVIGADSETDLAVLQIKAANLTPLLLGNSDNVKTGQTVFAVGNPLGLQESVTHGIISAKSRRVDEPSQEYFQTDAAINEGNSGGPLVDLQGEVIGINTRIAAPANHVQPQGLSFAIPSNVARLTMESIIKFHRVVHSYLGVTADFVPTQLSAEIGVSQANSALVVDVKPGSPAEKAGLKPGDVITKFNNREIAGPRDLYNRVAEIPINTDVPVTVVHSDGKPAPLTVHIAERPADFDSPVNVLAGLTISNLPPIRPTDIPDTVKGVIITNINPDSPIGKIAGSLQVGDIIQEINRVPITSIGDVLQVAKQLPPPPQQTIFLIYRGGANTYVAVNFR